MGSCPRTIPYMLCDWGLSQLVFEPQFFHLKMESILFGLDYGCSLYNLFSSKKHS